MQKEKVQNMNKIIETAPMQVDLQFHNLVIQRIWLEIVSFVSVLYTVYDLPKKLFQESCLSLVTSNIEKFINSVDEDANNDYIGIKYI